MYPITQRSFPYLPLVQQFEYEATVQLKSGSKEKVKERDEKRPRLAFDPLMRGLSFQTQPSSFIPISEDLAPLEIRSLIEQMLATEATSRPSAQHAFEMFEQYLIKYHPALHHAIQQKIVKDYRIIPALHISKEVCKSDDLQTSVCALFDAWQEKKDHTSLEDIEKALFAESSVQCPSHEVSKILFD